ncbi:hypothetical protein [Borreliella americana]|nr:hypothetical protein [Borreliella americana]MCD2332765.1 hypothetical protein [Borreliella americana]
MLIKLNQKKLKFPLISYNNKEYGLEIDNFLSKFDFKSPSRNE